MTEEDRRKFHTHHDYVRSEGGMIAHAREVEGREEGLAEGMQKGKEEGIEEGARERSLETARALKQSGMPPTRITEITGVPRSYLAKL
uniref:Essential protein Yae1, N terminal n=1 Tax=Candidatus Kentrum sp. UNK TaxID=2126344 RepID=A0A451AR68_9GAMM|nr:MAG: conserved hypothetical protein (putative transposase or invertase) [Candidatus Kentron sp. UNK]VFK73618.1 MAG: conserved hypothetical protein (putative transposase or invertase) [Candidatus Kentron sp. UNK]